MTITHKIIAFLLGITGLTMAVAILQYDAMAQLKAEYRATQALLAEAKGHGVGQWSETDDLMRDALNGKLAQLDMAQAKAAITLRILRRGKNERLENGTYQVVSTGYAHAHRMADAIVTAASEERLSYAIFAAVCEQESGYDPHAISKVGAIGLCQVMPLWVGHCPGIGAELDLHVPERNAKCGAHVLRTYLDLYNEDIKMALLAYNRGPGAVAKDQRMGFPEDNGYPGKVMARTVEF